MSSVSQIGLSCGHGPELMFKGLAVFKASVDITMDFMVDPLVQISLSFCALEQPHILNCEIVQQKSREMVWSFNDGFTWYVVSPDEVCDVYFFSGFISRNC